MLDKTLPYFNVIMKRRAGLPIAMHRLPSGFFIAGFVPGDEISWACIETAVGEFATEDEALTYFQTAYLPYSDELTRRCVFIRGADGGAVGTITSWWNWTEERRHPSVHWLAVRPDYQGLGLGKALVSECLKRLMWLEGDRDIWLHTQTWSHRAIAIYLRAGFEFMRQDTFGGYPNDYEQAMPVLYKKLRAAAPQGLVSYQCGLIAHEGDRTNDSD